jgi:short-subunit dehydrogenase
MRQRNKAQPLPWQRVWVTGASSGIGKDLCKLLCAMGITVMASARSTNKLAQLLEETKDYQGTLILAPIDITDDKAIKELLATWVNCNTFPDLAILNAGTHDPFSAHEFCSSRAKSLIDINLYGTINCLDPLLRYYHQQNSGHIAIISSAAGYTGLPTAAAYGASKAALINLCESLYLDLMKTNIKLQLITPGFVKTPLTDRNQFSMPSIISSTQAAQFIVNGLKTNAFEIRFPKVFMYTLSLLKLLPYSLYFKVISRITQ